MSAVELLEAFAERAGLTGPAQPERYLWTDAFAVMTWVGLHERTGERRFLDLAEGLVRQVHEVLGVSDDAAHPTAQGIRIGKPLPERQPDEPYDPELEWERDGQYYHYLTKWMHALQRTASASGEERYRHWAVELAQAAFRAFAYPPSAPRRMYWKMSIDLSRPLVMSMGAHDPLDGLIEAASLGLERETRGFLRMCEARELATDDPLGAGGLLLAALRLDRLTARGEKTLEPLFSAVVENAVSSTQAAAAGIGGPAARRLAFRELGLALGLHAVAPLRAHIDVQRLQSFIPLAEELERFWLDPANQTAPTWIGHQNINAVTLASCIAPEGVLDSRQ